jgi:hypothetical protein
MRERHHTGGGGEARVAAWLQGAPAGAAATGALDARRTGVSGP